MDRVIGANHNALEDEVMKYVHKMALVIALVVALALPGTAFARGLYDDKVVAGDSITVKSGEVLDGSLLLFGGTAVIEDGATIQGDLVVFGGTVSVDGLVEGNLIGFGGVISLGETAVIEKNLNTVGSVVNRAAGARIEGNVSTGYGGPFRFTMPGVGNQSTPQVPRLEMPIFSILGKIWWFFFMTFVWAGLAVLVGMFLPNPIERIAHAAVEQPAMAGGVGLLIAVVGPLLLVGIAITIILIPISLIGALVLAAAWFLGRISLGYEVGRRLEKMFKLDWPAPVSAGIGTFVLALFVDGAGELIPCIGWLLPALVGILGVGAVALTRFGSQTYLPVGSGAVSQPTRMPTDPGPEGRVTPGVSGVIAGAAAADQGGSEPGGAGDEPVSSASSASEES
jgi:hypothetical protein